MRRYMWLVSAVGMAGLLSGSAAAESGCQPFGFCAAPTSSYANYSGLRAGYAVRYRTVRVPARAVYGYRVSRTATTTQRRAYRVYYNRTVNFSDYSSPYAGPSVPWWRN
jgi:hypothetical protein